MEEFDQNEGEFRTSVADAMNGQLADGTSGRKRQEPQQVAADDVIIVAPSPRILENEDLEIVFFVQSKVKSLKSVVKSLMLMSWLKL